MIPEKIMYEGEANYVRFNGFEGEMTVLGHHMPLFTQIKTGELEYENEEGKHILAVGAGIAHIENNEVSIAIDTAVFAADINEQAAQDAKDAAEKLLSKRGDVHNEELLRGQLELANLHLKVYTKYRSSKRGLGNSDDLTPDI